MKTDISAIIDSFFRRFSQEFRPGKIEAFEAIMALAIGHAFGCYHPNQWADYLGLTPQKIYAQILLSIYYSVLNKVQTIQINPIYCCRC